MRNDLTKASRRTRVVKRVSIVVAVVLGVALVGALGARAAYRAITRSAHAIDEPGIDQAGLVEIGGIQQYVNIRGKDVANPVILFLHGGPGSPMTPFIHTYQYEWEDDYTVVNWDQRHSGKTYYANDVDAVQATMSFDRMLTDAWEVTQYVQRTLGKEKLIVMGHSWGSVLGTALVQTHPEAFSAFIGVGQVTNMLDNERVGYEAVIAAAQAAENEKDVQTLEELAPYPPEVHDKSMMDGILVVRQMQQKYGLASGMNITMLTQAVISPYYTLGENLYFLRVNTGDTQDAVFRYLFEEFDIHDYGTKYSVPVYYLIGSDDFQTPITLSKAFFSEIDAPDKEFYEIPEASHFTMLENKAEFDRILLQELRPKLG